MIIDFYETEAQRNKFSQPTYVKDFKDYGQIHHIHFSPFEWTKDVILLSFENKILFVRLLFKENILIEKVYEFAHPTRCTALGISPNMSLTVVPNQVIFTAAGTDYKIRIFESDLQENNLCKMIPEKKIKMESKKEALCLSSAQMKQSQKFVLAVDKMSIVLTGHTSYINDISFDSENMYLASASDDNTVKIWCCDKFKLKSTFHLTSAAITVAWHRSDPGKLLVAEKIGLVKFFNTETETPILSLDFAKSLSSAHWAPSDSRILGTLQLGELLLWDLTKPCLPQQSTLLFSENGGNIKFSPQGELVAAVNSLDGSLKAVHTITQSLKLTASVSLPTNVQWHLHYPVVCVGDDTKLCFWKITSF